jgi:hypothetical protein
MKTARYLKINVNELVVGRNYADTTLAHYLRLTYLGYEDIHVMNEPVRVYNFLANNEIVSNWKVIKTADADNSLFLEELY